MHVSRYFHDPADYDWVKILKLHYASIKKEWLKAPLHIRQPQTHYRRGKKIQKGDSKWDLVVLMDKDQIVPGMRDYFPETMGLITKIPIFENLAFSIFYPGTELIPHRGWSLDIVRVHLAIDTNDESALCCGGHCQTLKDGEVLIFEDGEEHYAYNRSDRERIILFFDVLKTRLKSDRDM